MGSDVNRLWVKVSAFEHGNIFALYPKLLSKIFRENKNSDWQEQIHAKSIVFPSDDEWRLKIYYHLVEKQRAKVKRVPTDSAWFPPQDQDKLLSNTFTPTAWESLKRPYTKRQKCSLESSQPSLVLSSKSIGTVDWTVNDLVKAGSLLSEYPLEVNFFDEQEMRRVFSLIYDVLRYKNILNQALKDVSFFYQYPTLKNQSTIVWLLLYDLYHRRFLKRDPNENSEDKFKKIGMQEVDDALWRSRIKLAASVSRLRIKNSALTLNQLLPPHLRDERVSKVSQVSLLYCWINSFRIQNFEEIIYSLKNYNLELHDESNDTLSENQFRWDPICPQFITFHPTQRNVLLHNPLAHRMELIIQDKSFCLGPAVFNNLLEKFELTGNVIQTHINSPKATAYLASLLAHNDRVGNVIVFGAGTRKTEYENYMKDVGASNVKLHAGRFIDVPSENEIFENVSAVFATPPNSYSAVQDPIDLVCSRGGDLAMLQVLTECDINEDGRKRIADILEDQRLTLHYAMCHPRIQIILYETHSVVDAENKDMVRRVLSEMNRLVREHHATQQGINIVRPITVNELYDKLEDVEVKGKSDYNNNDKKEKEKGENDAELSEKLIASTEYKRFSLVSQISEDQENLFSNVKVPPCDLFEEGKIPDLCPNSDSCVVLEEEGCYLALLQRKEITHLDAKYMINVAESRGLFRNDADDAENGETVKRTASKASRVNSKKSQPADVRRRSSTSSKTTQRFSLEAQTLERISAPTQSSFNKRTTPKISSKGVNHPDVEMETDVLLNDGNPMIQSGVNQEDIIGKGKQRMQIVQRLTQSTQSSANRTFPVKKNWNQLPTKELLRKLNACLKYSRKTKFHYYDLKKAGTPPNTPSSMIID